MPSARSQIRLALYRFRENPDYDQIVSDKIVDRVRKLDAQAREEGLAGLDANSGELVRLGMEYTRKGKVTKNAYGVFHLPWLAAENPGWAEMIRSEIEEVRKNIRRAHGVGVRYLIWAGMGGSAEDKAFYQSAGLLRSRVRVFILDSTDPAKLAAILEKIAQAEKKPLDQALKRCLVVGMALGATSYEPVVNLEKLDELYRKLRIAPEHNFLYMTLPDSILDRFGKERGFRRVELQPDNGNSTAGRHSSPLTRGSLYPLALNNAPLADWMKATQLSDDEIDSAFQLSGFIQANARAGRNKVTLHLPRAWSGGAVWTKQDFEESLGKSEEIGLKVVINEKIKPVNYLPPKAPSQDRCFLFVMLGMSGDPDNARITTLKRAGYPVAVLKVSGQCPVARYMQFIHYTVFGLGWLRKMNFVTQPGVELYKNYAREINARASALGGIDRTEDWKRFSQSPHRLRWIGGLSVDFGPLVRTGLISESDLQVGNRNAPAAYARALQALVDAGKVDYGELTYFGDTRYDAGGQQMRRTLDRCGDAVFRSRLKMPVDVYEGPAMNHSFHEMIIGYGHGFSTVVITNSAASIRKVQYTADYHRAQWLATQRALEDRGRAVLALKVRDLSEASLSNLREFFKEAARVLKRRS